jgi:tetratricopeptide (TPR) repeat protein
VIALSQTGQEYNPDEMLFYYFEGFAHFLQDDHEQALEVFRKGTAQINDESNPEIVSDFYAMMGDILHEKGQSEEAFAAYDSCLVWKEDNIGCLNNYAYYLSERGERLSKAEEMSYKTIKAEPKNSTYLDTYAWILYMEKRYAEAKIYIEQAVQNLDEKQDNSVILEHADKIKLKIKEE